MSSTDTVRSRGELLRAVVVRLAVVGGLTVAAWLAGAVTANAAEVSARAGDPSPSAVLQQGEQPMDALARAGICGDPDPCAAADSLVDSSSTSSADAAGGSGSHAAAALRGTALSSAYTATSSLAAAAPGGSREPASAALLANQAPSAGQLNAAPAIPLAWTGVDARPATWSSADSMALPATHRQWQQPLGHPFGMRDPAGPFVAMQAGLPSALTANAQMAGAFGSLAWAGQSPQRDDQAVALQGEGSPGAVQSDPGQRAAALLAGCSTAARLPADAIGARGGTAADTHGVLRSAGGSWRLITAAAADLHSRWTSTDRHGVDASGRPALPRPEPDPQPIAPAPPAPAAAPNGHPETGGNRGTLGVLPAQFAVLAPMLVDADRVGGSVLVPGVLHQPTVSPD